MRHRISDADARFRTATRALRFAVLLWICAAPAKSALAQSLNDLLGGSDSALAPAQQAEPKLTVSLVPDGTLAAGTTVTLSIRAEYGPDAYTYSQNPAFGGATKIRVTEVYGLEPIDEQFTPDHAPKVAYEELVGQDLEKFPGGVTWSRRYRYAGNVPSDEIYVTGKVDYQVCDKQNCRPMREEFEAFVDLDAPPTATPAEASVADAMPASPLPEASQLQERLGSLADSTAGSVAPRNSKPEPTLRAAMTPEEMGEEPLTFNLGARADEASLPWYLLMAFLGGLILNIMPCVLPVLAIKVMSFVQQAGESRGRVLALNISYSLGVVAVFLVLATLAVTLKIGWGGLFQRPEFNLAMIALVFSMGLSMLGVFEIPIPGMIGSAGGQHREGLFGAFFIGIFATLLATPCSGPLMTSVLAWSVKQDPHIVYLVWGVMGLGMASPFLAVGMVPGFARFIPRPGDWMVRFKEFSGFALLAAVLWLMNSLPAEVILPTLIMLLGIGLGLWMIGRMYDHASTFTRKLTVRCYALLTMGLICWFGFSKYTEGQALAEARRSVTPIASIEAGLRTGTAVAADAADGTDGQIRLTSATRPHAAGELPWEPFSGERLTELLRAGKPVLVDFTADWCLICKQNEKLALNTEKTNAFVREHGVVTLYADYTRTDAEIQAWLEKFGSISVPLTVIFPEGDPQNPHILDGPYYESTLLELLKQSVNQDVALRDRQSTLVDKSVR